MGIISEYIWRSVSVCDACIHVLNSQYYYNSGHRSSGGILAKSHVKTTRFYRWCGETNTSP
jgi:hypothetical protein